MVQELLDVEAVLLVTVRRVLEIGVLRQVVLVRQERPHAPELEDALAAVQHRQLIHRGKLMARPLVVHAVGLLAALAHPGVEHIYGLLMEIRFPNRYHIKRDYAPKTLSWPVLSMFLEPLAENILQHALVGRTNGVILLRSFCRDGLLVIQVADNGIGMDEITLNWVTEQMRQASAVPAAQHTNGSVRSEKSGTTEPAITPYSIGLSNIYRRMKLAFGEQADILIRSKENHYTVIEVIVPPENRLL